MVKYLPCLEDHDKMVTYMYIWYSTNSVKAATLSAYCFLGGPGPAPPDKNTPEQNDSQTD